MFEAFNNYSNFAGRARRSEYWLFQLLNLIVIGFAGLLILFGGGQEFAKGNQSGGGMFLFGAALLAFWGLIAFVPSLAVGVRRFHDHGVSGWWYGGLLLVSLIPYVGILASLALLWTTARPGTWGPNYFGPDPINPWRGLNEG
jgi:uncharacterized membrane protein YhaH (DUF805 family)